MACGDTTGQAAASKDLLEQAFIASDANLQETILIKSSCQEKVFGCCCPNCQLIHHLQQRQATPATLCSQPAPFPRPLRSKPEPSAAGSNLLPGIFFWTDWKEQAEGNLRVQRQQLSCLKQAAARRSRLQTCAGGREQPAAPLPLLQRHSPA